MLHFNNIDELEYFVDKAGGKIVWPKRRRHYLIFGTYIDEPVGCCWDRASVLLEEQNYTFKPVAKKNCPVCNSK